MTIFMKNIGLFMILNPLLSAKSAQKRWNARIKCLLSTLWVGVTTLKAAKYAKIG